MLHLLPSLYSWLLDASPLEGAIVLVAVGVVVAPYRTNAAAPGLYHIMSSCTAIDDALIKWTLAKRKMTVHKYGAPSEKAFHNALLSDMHQSDRYGDPPGACPSEMECIDEYDATEVGTTFCSLAFSASTPPGRDLSDFWVVDFACSIYLTAFRSDFVSFDPPSGPCSVGGVGVDVLGSGNVEIAIPLVYGRIGVARFTRCIPMTYRRALHNALAAS
jgi:hypothetical protein